MRRPLLSSRTQSLAASASGEDLLRLYPPVLEMALVILASMIALIGFAYGSPLNDVTNLLAPTILVAGLIFGGVTIVRRDVTAIWIPLFWNRMAFVAYYGVGTLVPYFSNEDTRNLIDSFYTLFPQDVAKYNLVICLFTLCYLLFSIPIIRTFNRANPLKSARAKRLFPASNLDYKTIGIILFSVGYLVYLILVLPFALGIIKTLPLFVTELSQGAWVGVFLLTVWAERNSRYGVYAIIAFVTFQFFLGLMILSKSESMLPFVVMCIGMIYVKPTLTRIAVLGSLSLVVFMTIAPIVTHARNVALHEVESTQNATLSLRVSALASYFDPTSHDELDNPVQVGWARLSYVNGGTFAINAYDSGRPGHSLDNALTVWIPRFIYKDKPSITAGSLEFNLAIQGVDTSASTPGLPTEAYWVGGWMGVVLVAFLVALVSTLWSVYSVLVLKNDSWHLFFVVLLGMRAGIRMDGMIVPDILGPISYAVLGHIALQFLNRLLNERKKPVAILSRA